MKKDPTGSKNKYKHIGYHQFAMQVNDHAEIDFVINEKCIYRLVKELGMQSEYRQKNPYKNTDKPDFNVL